MRRDRGREERRKKLPARERLSREEGAIVKDWGGRLPVALVYPNSYYLGMSSLGIQALYALLNGYDTVVCERAFWEGENAPVLSVESRRPLNDFAVIAFSVSYELDYFNMVKALKASGIPLYAADRDERHPLLIAGGPCISSNPAPLSPFFDCLCIGEAEPIVPALLPRLLEGSGSRRHELLAELARLPGIYVPQQPAPAVRQRAKNLDDFPVSSVVLTPDTELGDLYLMEVERGCNWGCRFCLVCTAFSPMRLHSAASLLRQAQEGLAYRQRIGLVGPAVTDHPQIEEVLAELLRMGAGLSISSLRLSSLTPRILSQLAQGGVRTITLAPEAGSQRLRQVIKKSISEEDVLRAADNAAQQGFRQLKLYFMIGLPTEGDKDIDAIARLTLAAKDILDRRQKGSRITLNVAPFVPKAGTPFQWLPMAPLPVLNRRLSMLKSHLLPRGINVKSESPAWSQVQGILARGDGAIAGALAETENVTLSGWQKALAKCRIDPEHYTRQWDTGMRLPWEMIDTGIKREHLEKELGRAMCP